MKRIIALLLVLICILLVTSCGKEDTPVDPLANQKNAVALLNNYDLTKSYGFEYTLIQSISGVEANRKSVVVSLNEARTSGTRVEVEKVLNTSFTGDQYTTTTTTTRFENGQIGTGEGESITWNAGSLGDLAGIKLSAIRVEWTSIKDLTFENKEGNYVLCYTVEYPNAYLGLSTTVSNFIVELTVDTSLTKLVGIKMSYDTSNSHIALALNPTYTPKAN